MDGQSVVACTARLQLAARPVFDLAAALGKLDRRVALLQHAVSDMAHTAEGVADDDLAILGEVAQEIRSAVVALRIETDGLRLVAGFGDQNEAGGPASD